MLLSDIKHKASEPGFLPHHANPLSSITPPPPPLPCQEADHCYLQGGTSLDLQPDTTEMDKIVGQVTDATDYRKTNSRFAEAMGSEENRFVKYEDRKQEGALTVDIIKTLCHGKMRYILLCFILFHSILSYPILSYSTPLYSVLFYSFLSYRIQFCSTRLNCIVLYFII